MRVARREGRGTMSVEDYSHLACPNPECTICGQHFSERANTPLFGLRTSEETLLSIARHLAEGTGCRATARLCGVCLNTVLRFTQRFGHHAERFHDSMV